MKKKIFLVALITSVLIGCGDNNEVKKALQDPITLADIKSISLDTWCNIVIGCYKPDTIDLSIKFINEGKCNENHFYTTSYCAIAKSKANGYYEFQKQARASEVMLNRVSQDKVLLSIVKTTMDKSIMCNSSPPQTDPYCVAIDERMKELNAAWDTSYLQQHIIKILLPQEEKLREDNIREARAIIKQAKSTD